MNVWLVIGGVGVLLLVIVLVGTRRPRRAEDELAPPASKPARTDVSGSVDPAGLKAVLRSIQAGRETGTLQVVAGDLTGSLYFLFGHLFHATSGMLTGEPALQELLSWQHASYTFDRTGKLPTEETIERPMDEIVA